MNQNTSRIRISGVREEEEHRFTWMGSRCMHCGWPTDLCTHCGITSLCECDPKGPGFPGGHCPNDL